MKKALASAFCGIAILAVALVCGVGLLVVLNGFGERAATSALAAYGLLSLVASGLAAGLVWLPLRSTLAAMGLGVTSGLGVIVVAFFAAVAIADARHPRPPRREIDGEGSHLAPRGDLRQATARTGEVAGRVRIW